MRIILPWLLAALIVTGCRAGRKPQAMPPLEVDVAVVRLDSLRDKITFTTTVEPLYEAIIEPRVSGYLQAILYDDGMPVRRGATIFTIDPIEYQTSLAAAKASYAEAEAALALARSNYERSRPLAAIDALSQMEAQQYKTTYLAAVSSAEAARQSVEIQSLNLGYTTISAPIDGLIAATTAKQGDYVGVGTSFTTLTSIKYIDTVTLSLPIAQSRYLNYRTLHSFDNATLLCSIEITLPNGESYPHNAEYYYTKQSGGDNTSTLIVVVRAANPELLLKSGMFARVKADIGELKAKVVIPQKAVTQSQGVSSVWVVKQGRVKQHPVTVGTSYGDMWSVESGVELGDTVLLTGSMKVRDGERVNAKNAQNKYN